VEVVVAAERAGVRLAGAAAAGRINSWRSRKKKFVAEGEARGGCLYHRPRDELMEEVVSWWF
jgi:hypothetical protein